MCVIDMQSGLESWLEGWHNESTAPIGKQESCENFKKCTCINVCILNQ